MTRRQNGRAAFVFAAGLLLFAAGPTRAAPSEGSSSADAVEQSADAGKPLALTKAKKARPQKVSRNRKPAKVAAIKADKKAKQIKAAPVSEPQMPASVANANAQMPSADAQGAAAITETPPLEAAAAEQLTELGKSLTAPAADEPRQMAQLAVNDQPQAAPPLADSEPTRPLKQARMSSSTDAWAQSSLIGKIFIAFGGMLTLASAARMLVA